MEAGGARQDPRSPAEAQSLTLSPTKAGTLRLRDASWPT